MHLELVKTVAAYGTANISIRDRITLSEDSKSRSELQGLDRETL